MHDKLHTTERGLCKAVASWMEYGPSVPCTASSCAVPPGPAFALAGVLSTYPNAHVPISLFFRETALSKSLATVRTGASCGVPYTLYQCR